MCICLAQEQIILDLKSNTKARGSGGTLCACVETIYLLSFVIHLLGCDSAALLMLCLYVVAYLVMFVTDVIQRPEEVGRLCAKGQDVSVK